ncbi:hypothetical protein ACHAWF_011838 [Thalassiosira exigua]
MPLKEESARRLATWAGNVTPRGIARAVSRAKTGLAVVKHVRRAWKFIDRYKAVLVLVAVGCWIRASLRAPHPALAGGTTEVARTAAAAFGLLVAPARIPAFGDEARSFRLGGAANGSEDDDGVGVEEGGIEGELERLQSRLQLIEALEERNRAQLDSFVDERHQWDSLEEDERALLKSKESTSRRMEALTEELAMLFLGQKTKDG